MRQDSAVGAQRLSLGNRAKGFDPNATCETATLTLGRALSLVKAFAGDSRPLSHAELMRRTGYSRAAISRLISTLVALGYLSRAADGVRYQIGLGSFRLGHAYLSASPVRVVARPVMQKFADTHHVAVALAVGHYDRTIYIEHCKANDISTLHLAVGDMPPVELTAVGRAFLWTLPPAKRSAIIQDVLSRNTGDAAAIASRIEAAFGSIAENGYCLAIGEYRPDTYGIAVPVYLGQPPVAMVLNCSAVSVAPNKAYLETVLAPALVNAAEMLRTAFFGVDGELL